MEGPRTSKEFYPQVASCAKIVKCEKGGKLLETDPHHVDRLHGVE